MDFIWTPWRYRYIAETAKDKNAPEDACIFCALQKRTDDAAAHILLRAEKNFVVLNAFPYTAGHLMVVPYKHGGEFPVAEPETLAEMMRLAQQMQVAIQRAYSPDGFNLGINLGRSAGAGVADHLHMHLLPRWTGDANFMSVVGETRLIPEDLDSTYAKLRRELGLS